jgi:hypothetical protein
VRAPREQENENEREKEQRRVMMMVVGAHSNLEVDGDGEEGDLEEPVLGEGAEADPADHLPVAQTHQRTVVPMANRKKKKNARHCV